MKRRILFFLFTSFLCACTSPVQQTHLPRATMEQILFDMQLADVYSTMTRPDSITVNVKDMDSLAAFYSEILQHHKITQETFLASMSWYEEHPEELDSIYVRITERLGLLSGEDKE